MLYSTTIYNSTNYIVNSTTLNPRFRIYLSYDLNVFLIKVVGLIRRTSDDFLLTFTQLFDIDTVLQIKIAALILVW